jgi:hypothetical protein
VRTEQTTLSATRVHLEVRVLSKLVDVDKHAAVCLGRPQLSTAIVTPAPNGCNLCCELLSRDSFTQRAAEVDTRSCIQAQIPQAVSRKPTTVAAPTERRSGRSDDPKDRTVR